MSFSRNTLRAAAKVAAPAARQTASKRSMSLLSRQAPKVAMAARATGVRGVKTLDFAGTKEVVYERADWPLDKLQECVTVASDNI